MNGTPDALARPSLATHQARAVAAVADAIHDSLTRWVCVLRDGNGDEVGWLDDDGRFTCARWLACQHRTQADAARALPRHRIIDGHRWAAERWMPLSEAVAS